MFVLNAGFATEVPQVPPLVHVVLWQNESPKIKYTLGIPKAPCVFVMLARMGPRWADPPDLVCTPSPYWDAGLQDIFKVIQGHTIPYTNTRIFGVRYTSKEEGQDFM